jgi:hypothetical protein
VIGNYTVLINKLCELLVFSAVDLSETTKSNDIWSFSYCQIFLDHR